MTKTLQSVHPLAVAVLTSGLATGISYVAPAELSGSLVGFVFLFATYIMALPRDATLPPAHFGLALGGLLEAAPLSPKRILRASLKAVLQASMVAIVILPCFYLGFELWYQPERDFNWTLALSGDKNFQGTSFLLDLAMGHLLVVALPEEAFFRGYLQSALDDRLKYRLHLPGAQLGISLLIVSAVFALGHFATTGAIGRLAVFFPSLLFGYLRVLTGGIGAPLVLHAQFNIAAALLGRGFGLY